MGYSKIFTAMNYLIQWHLEGCKALMDISRSLSLSFFLYSHRLGVCSRIIFFLSAACSKKLVSGSLRNERYDSAWSRARARWPSFWAITFPESMFSGVIGTWARWISSCTDSSSCSPGTAMDSPNHSAAKCLLVMMIAPVFPEGM